MGFHATAAKTLISSQDQLIKTLVSLTSSPMTKITSTKIVESSLVGKKTNYTGEIFLSQGKFRWDTKTPEISTLLFDGKALWVIENQFITKTKLSKDAKSQTLTTILFNPKSLKKKFDLEEKSSTENAIVISLKPKAKDITVSDIVVTYNSVTKDLEQLSYSENDNKTTIEFHKIEKMKKANASYFKYKAKPGDKITEL